MCQRNVSIVHRQKSNETRRSKICCSEEKKFVLFSFGESSRAKFTDRSATQKFQIFQSSIVEFFFAKSFNDLGPRFVETILRSLSTFSIVEAKLTQRKLKINRENPVDFFVFPIDFRPIKPVGRNHCRKQSDRVRR